MYDPKRTWHLLRWVTAILASFPAGHFVVKTAELVEAEGRLARRECRRLIRSGLYGLLATGLGLIGCALLFVGGGLHLAEAIGLANALLALGGAALLIALGVACAINVRHEN